MWWNRISIRPECNNTYIIRAIIYQPQSHSIQYMSFHSKLMVNAFHTHNASISYFLHLLRVAWQTHTIYENDKLIYIYKIHPFQSCKTIFISMEMRRIKAKKKLNYSIIHVYANGCTHRHTIHIRRYMKVAHSIKLPLIIARPAGWSRLLIYVRFADCLAICDR